MVWGVMCLLSCLSLYSHQLTSKHPQVALGSWSLNLCAQALTIFFLTTSYSVRICIPILNITILDITSISHGKESLFSRSRMAAPARSLLDDIPIWLSKDHVVDFEWSTDEKNVIILIEINSEIDNVHCGKVIAS